jgi:hypothetical protein
VLGEALGLGVQGGGVGHTTAQEPADDDVDRPQVRQGVHVDGQPHSLGQQLADPVGGEPPLQPRVARGDVVGARSGDKGGNANVGLWVRTPEAYAWMVALLSPERLAELYPEARRHRVERFELPNLLAVNLVFHGLLEEGVAASTRQDAQAKGLGEYLRARVVDVPVALLS